MGRVGTTERSTYQDVWSSVNDYGAWSSGVTYQELFMQRVGTQRGLLLDAGCGNGRATMELMQRGFQVAGCDVTNEGVETNAEGEVEFPFLTELLWHDLKLVAYCASAWYKERQDRRIMAEAVPAVDWAYCCDVMEHIPQALTMLVADRLVEIARKEVFMVIALEADRGGYWVGKPLHQTVKPFTWWRDHLGEVAPVLEARDLIHHGAFWLAGRAREKQPC